MKQVIYDQFYELLDKPAKATSNTAADWALNSSLYMEVLLDIAQSTNNPYSYRACWAIICILEKQPSFLHAYIDVLSSFYPQLAHRSQKGSLMKVISRLPISQEYASLVIDTCVYDLHQETIPDFIKVYSMHYLLLAANEYPDLAFEFKEVITNVYGSFKKPFILGSAKKVLRQLEVLIAGN